MGHAQRGDVERRSAMFLARHALDTFVLFNAQTLQFRAAQRSKARERLLIG